MLFTLTFDIFFDNFDRCATCSQQAKTLAPKVFFPEFLANFRKLLFQKPAACAFVCVYKFAYLRIWMCFEQNMNMIFIVIPLLQSDVVIWCDILEYFLCTIGNIVIKDFPSIFYYKHKMIV